MQPYFAYSTICFCDECLGFTDFLDSTNNNHNIIPLNNNTQIFLPVSQNNSPFNKTNPPRFTQFSQFSQHIQLLRYFPIKFNDKSLSLFQR